MIFPVSRFMNTIVIGVALGVAACGPAFAQAPPPPQAGQPPMAPLPPDQLQQLVAPIALYPDSLVAQILAAATYPTQIVEAERFLQQNPGLTGQSLGNAVDQQDWDPSVKALTAFPSVLADMNNNLSWTSELGDANYNQPQDVMNAIQFMRQKAQAAGNLQSTPQQTVTDNGSDVEIAPANPDMVYVPEYDPSLVYGYPVPLWPGFDPWWGAGGPYISFGIGIGVGPFFGFGWGWNHWGCGWGLHPGLFFGGSPWYSRSHAFYDHNAFVHGNYRGFGGRGFNGGDRGRGFAGGGVRGGERGFAGGGFHGGAGERGFAGGNRSAFRGFGGNSNPGIRSGAFSGFGHGGDVRSFGSRGMSSMHGGFGGGGFHGGGGGGFHGGGGRR